MTARDRAALSPLFTHHVNPFGRFDLDLEARIRSVMSSRLQIDVEKTNLPLVVRMLGLPPAEPNQESLVGTGEYLPDGLHPRIY